MGNGLRDRVADNIRRPAVEPGTEVEKKKPATLAEEIETWQQEFQLAMPRGAEAQLLVRDALHLLRTTRNLAACDPNSVIGGLMSFAQLGLRPGVEGQGWLIPFKKWNPNTRQEYYLAQIIIGYRGYVQLAHRGGNVKIVGRAVHERDELHVLYGSEGERIDHQPYGGAEGRGDVVGYWSAIRPVGGMVGGDAGGAAYPHQVAGGGDDGAGGAFVDLVGAEFLAGQGGGGVGGQAGGGGDGAGGVPAAL